MKIKSQRKLLCNHWILSSSKKYTADL